MPATSPAAEAARLVDTLGPQALATAQAYTVQSELLLVAGVGVSVLVAFILVRLGIMERIAGWFAGRNRALATFLTAAGFFLAAALIELPWTIFTSWWHERAFGLTTQPLGDFLGQLALSQVISAAIGGLFLLGVYTLIRRTGSRWWLWASGLTALATVLMLLAVPTLLMPLFNRFEPVPPGQVRSALETIADRVDIPHDRIFMYDGSRQSENFTANVAGIGPSARIAISDVALKQASLAEVKAVTGHEAGHYKLGHVWRHVVVLPLIAMLVLFLIDRLFPRAARLLGSPATLDDPRGLPVFMALVSVLTLFTSPFQNSLTRVGEAQADAYSLATVGEPDALASALIKTAEYRYPRPHWLEEVVFYNHPSVEKRVMMAMEWKAAHPGARPAAP